MSNLAHLLPGKTFRPASSRGKRIRIHSFTPGGSQAVIVNAASGKGKRWISIDNLHPTPLTQTGRNWKTGYILEES